MCEVIDKIVKRGGKVQEKYTGDVTIG